MLAVALLAVSSPFQVELLHDDHLYYRVVVGVADVGWSLLIALTILPVMRALRMRRPDWIGLLTLVFGALLLVAFLVHPSAQGVQTIFRFGAAVAIAVTIARMATAYERRLLLFAVAVTALIQTTMAALEYVLLGVTTPKGTFPHPFVLAGYALVTAAILAGRALVTVRPRWAVAAALAVAPVGVSSSRAAALAVGLMCAALVPRVLRGARGERMVMVALLLGAGIPALANLDAWTGRMEQYPPSASEARRLELITQTFPLLRESPFVGIGPGNTAAELRDLKARAPGSVDLIQPPHDVPYLVALETGIPGGLIAAALFLLIGLRALRLGVGPTVIFLALVPYLVLDDYAWTAPPGLPLLGLWAGAVLAGRIGVGDEDAGREPRGPALGDPAPS